MSRTPYISFRPSKPVRSDVVNRERESGTAKPVGGMIQGKKATSVEMMWARGLSQANKDFIFQFEVPTAYTLPGQGKLIDFIVDGQYADEIDGEIAHKTESQKQADFERDTQLAPILKDLGLEPIRRIDAEAFLDQNRVNTLIREYYL